MSHLIEASHFNTGVVSTLSTELQDPSPILMGHDVQSHFLDHLMEHDFDRVFLFVDEGVLHHGGKDFIAECRRGLGKLLDVTILPPGDSCKSWGMLETTCEDLLAKGASKKSILISFGGGAAGNLVGLAAGMVYRGLRYIEIPTTMTGQTDGVLSNKQAINGNTGKNHFGIYYSPLFIWCDTKYLMTEPARLKRCGLVEAIKNGFISDPQFLNYLENNLNPRLDYSAGQLHILARNVIESKLRILREDPSEKKYGIILEYGHTFGHGIEWLGRKLNKVILHGEAVAFGMRVAAKLSFKLGYIRAEDVELHHYMIEEKLGLTNPWPDFVDTDGLINAMIADNKKTGREVRYVLLEKLGRCNNPEGDYLTSVSESLVRETLNETIQQSQKAYA